jgi:hypothetical protein
LLGALFEDPKYDELFEQLGESKDPVRNRIELIGNITDWIDGNDYVDPVCVITGDDSRNTASEDIRYDHLPYGARYKPKNGQMASLAELRMVSGVNDAFMEIFSTYFTVWTDDAGINLNTADPLILQMVVRAMMQGPPQPGDAEKFAKFMQEWQLLRILPPPMNKMFLQLLQTAGIKIDQGTFNLLESKQILRFDDVSNVYKITAVGRVFDAVSTITAVWRDDGRLGEIRYWREE